MERPQGHNVNDDVNVSGDIVYNGEAAQQGVEYDYIIIGAGAAGSVVAGRLVQSGATVLVLEQGQDTSMPPNYPKWYEPLGPNDNPNVRDGFRPNLFAPSVGQLINRKPFAPFVPQNLYHNKMHLDFISENQSTFEIPIYGEKRYYGYPRGAGAGGSVQIAVGFLDGIGAPKLYDKLSTYLSDSSWNGQNVVDIAKNMETAFPPRNPQWYGNSGWYHISQPTVEPSDPIYTVIKNTAITQLGSEGVVDVTATSNWRETPTGIGLMDQQVVGASLGGDGYRNQSYRSFLQTFIGQSNLTIKFNSLVNKILIRDGSSGKEAYGVDVYEKQSLYKALHAGNTRFNNQYYPGIVINSDGDRSLPQITRYTARKEIIVCAGTFQTPQILMLSGIGDPVELAKHKIPLVVNSPKVGKNLIDHCELFAVWEMDPKKWISTLASSIMSVSDLTPSIADPLVKANASAKTNPLIFSEVSTGLVMDCWSGYDVQDLQEPDTHAFTITAFANNLDILNHGPNINLDDTHNHLSQFDRSNPTDPLNPVGLQDKSTITRSIFTPPAPRAFMTWLIENLKPTTGFEGTVTLRSDNPLDQPIINMNLYNDDAAIERVALTFMKIRNIMNSPAVQEAYGLAPPNYEVQPGSVLTTVADIKNYIKSWSSFGHHCCGTAAMGPDSDPTSVLDTKLRVKGVKGLRVADCSVFPSPYIPGYNTTRPAYVVGEQCAKFILNP